MSIISYSFILLFVFVIAKYRYRFNYSSPLAVFVIINFFGMVGGYYFGSAQSDGVSVIMSAHNYNYAVVVNDAVICLIFFCAGCLAASFFLGRLNSHKNKYEIKFDQISKFNPYLFSLISLTLYVLGNGYDGYFYRTYYQGESIKIIKIAGSLLCLLSVFINAASINKNIKSFFTLIPLSLLIIISCLVYSSRLAAISSLVTGVVLFGARKNFIKTTAFIFIILVPVLLNTVIFMRAQKEQGLLPLLEDILSGQIYQLIDFDLLLNNTIWSNFVITALTATGARIDLNYIVTSLNPLPGRYTDWYTLSSGLNDSTPYSSMGELLAFGLSFAIVYHVLLGIIFSFVEKKALSNKPVYYYIGRPMLYIYTITSLQYTTRASSRYLYYFVITLLLVKAYKVLFKNNNISQPG